MRRTLTTLAVALLAPSIGAQQPDPAVLALTNATVIDGTGGAAQPGMTVVIRDGRIQDLHPSAAKQPPAGAVAQRPPPIIDMHLHAERGTSRQDWAGVLRGLEEHGVVVSMLSVDDTAAVHARELWSNRFWLGAAFPCYEGRYPQMDPCFEKGDGWPDITWLRSQFESGRMRMMGEMLYVYFGIPPTDDRLAPYWALAEELDIPVGVHTGRGPYLRKEGCCPRFDDDLGDPSLLEPVLRRHPKLRVWLMHAPGWDYLDETIALMQSYPNVNAETSIVNSVMPAGMHEAHLRAIADAGLLDRIMFGSDNVPIGPILERIESVPFLSAEQKRAILYENAARFLRLTTDELARHGEHRQEIALQRGEPAVIFSALENRLLNADTARLDFHVTAEGAFEADLRGTLNMGPGERVRLTAAGHFGGKPVDLLLQSQGETMELSNGANRTTAARPPHLKEALLVGFTRMGILHNLARLTAARAPDHSDGGVRDWVTVGSFAAPENSHAVSFDVIVAGQPAGSATLEIDSHQHPILRRQTVRFPGGEMRVREKYSGVTIAP